MAPDKKGYPDKYFPYFSKKTCYEYSLELPHRDISNDNHNIHFHGEIRKILILLGFLFGQETPKRVTGKQCRPRSNLAEHNIQSGSASFALTTGIPIKYSNIKNLPDTLLWK